MKRIRSQITTGADKAPEKPTQARLATLRAASSAKNRGAEVEQGLRENLGPADDRGEGGAKEK
jgi:hypothetical protein